MATILRTPLIEELNTALTPVALFELFRSERFAFFLDSSMDSEKLGRYSLMGGAPFLQVQSRGEKIVVTQNLSSTEIQGNPFDVLGDYLARYRLQSGDFPVPCLGGAVGYFSYDLCHFIEKVPSKAVDDLNLPELNFGFYDLMVIFDNLLTRWYIVSNGFPELDEEAGMQRAKERLDDFKRRLKTLTGNTAYPVASSSSGVALKSNFTHQGYVSAVAKARQYIIDGDIFEVNLSQRFEAEIAIPPYDLFLRLREINPAPFSTYLAFDDLVVAGASPERFLRLQGDRVETRPIKGTIRRGDTPQEDRANVRSLLGSKKDHAENMMIVDLERNDLGRVCRYGTVKVTELAILEKYPTVYHLTSTVVGRLREGVGPMDLLKATFPGGSITGAPKVRSMEIIDQLEPTRRSVYTGSIGYLSFDGNLDLNIVIRTFLIKGNKAYFQAGGAVVYDSDPESEYQETLDKVRALISALNSFHSSPTSDSSSLTGEASQNFSPLEGEIK